MRTKELVDLAVALQQREAALAKALREVKARRLEIEMEIFSRLVGSQRPVITDLAQASIEQGLKLSVPDWVRVFEFIQKQGAFSLLYRRLSEGGYKKMLEQRNGKPIPGIEEEATQSLVIVPLPK